MPLHVVWQFDTLDPTPFLRLIGNTEVESLQFRNRTTVLVVMADGHTNVPTGFDRPTARFYAFIVNPIDEQSHSRTVTFIDSDDLPDENLENVILHNPNDSDVQISPAPAAQPTWTVPNNTPARTTGDQTETHVHVTFNVQGAQGQGYVRRENTIPEQERTTLVNPDGDDVPYWLHESRTNPAGTLPNGTQAILVGPPVGSLAPVIVNDYGFTHFVPTICIAPQISERLWHESTPWRTTTRMLGETHFRNTMASPVNRTPLTVNGINEGIASVTLDDDADGFVASPHLVVGTTRYHDDLPPIDFAEDIRSLRNITLVSHPNEPQTPFWLSEDECLNRTNLGGFIPNGTEVPVLATNGALIHVRWQDRDVVVGIGHTAMGRATTPEPNITIQGSRLNRTPLWRDNPPIGAGPSPAPDGFITEDTFAAAGTTIEGFTHVTLTDGSQGWISRAYITPIYNPARDAHIVFHGLPESGDVLAIQSDGSQAWVPQPNATPDDTPEREPVEPKTPSRYERLAQDDEP